MQTNPLTNAWRKRVDHKLNTLTRNYEDLSTRLDSYQKSLDTNTNLTKSINTKIDDLIATTADVVALSQKAKLGGKVLRWLLRTTHFIVVQIGQLGVAVLVVLSAYFVIKSAAPWAKAFVNIFNGNLS